MGETIQISAKLFQKEHDVLTDYMKVTYDDKTFALRSILRDYKALIDVGYKSITGLFTDAEQLFITTLFNGYLWTAGALPQKTILLGKITEHVEYKQPILEGVDVDVLIQKVESINELQAYCVNMKAYRFWYAGEESEPLDDIVGQFIASLNEE